MKTFARTQSLSGRIPDMGKITARTPVIYAVLASLAWFAPATPASAKDWGQIRIASEGGHPPFNFVDDMGRLHGFEIDLARAVCARLKANCEFVRQDFDGLIAALIAGRFDAVVSSLSMTEQRRSAIAFSDKYYETAATFVASKRNAGMSISPEAMKGRRIGAKIGSTNARYLQEVYGPAGVLIKLYLTQDEARIDLAKDRLDALLGDKTALLYWLEKSPDGQCCQLAGQDVKAPKYFGDGVGVGLRKTDPELKSLIDKALADLRSSGEYDGIRKMYFPYDVY